MNNLTIIGNLTKDPELRNTTDGKSVCNFDVAVNRRSKREGQPDADFFRVSAWNQLALNCQKYLAKGRKVYVDGPVSVRTYQRQDGSFGATMEIVARDVEFLSQRDDGAQAQTANPPVRTQTANPPVQTQMTQESFTPVDPGDDLPF